MKVVKNQYCNECKRNTHLNVTGENQESIFAVCPHCDADFDLINDGETIKEISN